MRWEAHEFEAYLGKTRSQILKQTNKSENNFLFYFYLSILIISMVQYCIATRNDESSTYEYLEVSGGK